MIDKNTITNAAQKFASRGQIDEAIAEWEKLLKVNQDGNVYNTIGDLYLKKRDHKKAVQSFEQAANIFREDGFYPKAIALFKKILNIAPDEVSALIALAQLNAERGFTNQAVDELKKVAEIFIQRNNIDKAIEVYERILRLAPDDITIKISIAETAHQAGKTDKACQAYSVIASDYLEKGELDKTEEYYKKALKLDSQDTSALTGLSNLADRKGDTEQALQCLNEAISVKPDDQSILLRYARLCIKAEKVDEAKKTLTSIVEKDASNLDARKLLGIIYSDEGQIEESWAQLQPCIDDAISDKNWADALAMLNNFGEVNSIPVRKRFVDIYRGSGDMESLEIELFELGVLYESKGESQEALKLYKETLELKPDNPEINDRVNNIESTDNGENSVSGGSAEEAQQDSAAESGDGSTDQYVEAKKTEADFYVQQGLHEEALKIYEELLEANPADADIIRAMNDLKSAETTTSTTSDTIAPPESAPGDINSAMNEILQGAGVDDMPSGQVDFESHFQRGIEYRRQGQTNEAINELLLSAEDPDNIVRNCRILGMCYAEQDNYRDAALQFEKACTALTADDDGFLDLLYELADAYIKNDESDKALAKYAEINRHDPTFRDVSEKMETLQSMKSQFDDIPEIHAGMSTVKTSSKKSRISYI